MNSIIDSYKNKLKQRQDLIGYNVHVEKIKKISSRKQLHKLQRQLSLHDNYEYNKAEQMKNAKMCRKVENMRQLQTQNQRLFKKLNQISRRKSQFVNNYQSKDQKKYYTINMRSRQANRRVKQVIIQHENDSMVERIVKKRKANRALYHDSSTDSLSSLRKSRHTNRNHSVILPKLYNKPTSPFID